MRTMFLMGILSSLWGSLFGQQRDWTIRGYSTTVVRHEVVSPGSFEVEGNRVTFLYKGITETAEIPDYHDEPYFHTEKDGKIVFHPEFWNTLDKVHRELERDEEWQRKGYPVEFRAFMVRTLKQLSIEKAVALGKGPGTEK